MRQSAKISHTLLLLPYVASSDLVKPVSVRTCPIVVQGLQFNVTSYLPRAHEWPPYRTFVIYVTIAFSNVALSTEEVAAIVRKFPVFERRVATVCKVYSERHKRNKEGERGR